jgi:hypothetical protein
LASAPTAVPALVLFDPVTKQPMPIGYGILSQDEIMDRVFQLTQVKPGVTTDARAVPPASSRSRAARLAPLGGAVLLASPSPASAGVEGEMQSFMSDMGVQANADRPQRLPGPVGGLLFDGFGLVAFPQKNIQPFNIQLPHARAGCGGIDLFAGSSRSSSRPSLSRCSRLRLTTHSASPSSSRSTHLARDRQGHG